MVLLSFIMAFPPGRLATRLAASCVFPPTRIVTPPARCLIFAMRFRKGTWMNELENTLQRHSCVMLPLTYELTPTDRRVSNSGVTGSKNFYVLTNLIYHRHFDGKPKERAFLKNRKSTLTAVAAEQLNEECIWRWRDRDRWGGQYSWIVCSCSCIICCSSRGTRCRVT